MNIAMESREDVIRAALANEIDWQDAMDLIKKLPSPWVSKQWKERREKFLDKKCATCSVTKEEGATLVIQHTWQPHKWCWHVQKHRKVFFQQWEASNPFDSQAHISKFKYEYEVRPLCPKCKGGVHRWKNQKDGIKKCTSIRDKISCGHEFHFSQLEEGPWSQRTYEQQLKTFNWPFYNAWQERFWAEMGAQVRQAAATDAFKESLRYMEMHPGDIKTLCKKCAAKEDRAYIFENQANKLIASAKKADDYLSDPEAGRE